VFVFGAILTFVAVRDSGYTEIATGPGQTERIELADGSVIMLAADSRLMYAEEGDDVRHVRLRAGQALFEVTRDEANPFTVETPAAVTTVLGTTFGVTATDIATDVVLVSGAVEVEARAMPGEKVRLAPGEGSRVLGASPPSAPAPAALASDLAWTGKLYVRAEPARSVAQQIGAAMGVTVTVDDALADELVTGTFDLDRSPADVLGLLAATLGADLEEDAGAFRLVAR
jgi:transmembrane sensor